MPYLSERNERLALTAHGMVTMLRPVTLVLWLHGPDPAPRTVMNLQPIEPSDDGVEQFNVQLVEQGTQWATVNTRLTVGVPPLLSDLAQLCMFYEWPYPSDRGPGRPFTGSALLLAEFLSYVCVGAPLAAV